MYINVLVNRIVTKKPDTMGVTGVTYSNITGGYGIFSGAAVSSDSIIWNYDKNWGVNIKKTIVCKATKLKIIHLYYDSDCTTIEYILTDIKKYDN